MSKLHNFKYLLKELQAIKQNEVGIKQSLSKNFVYCTECGISKPRWVYHPFWLCVPDKGVVRCIYHWSHSALRKAGLYNKTWISYMRALRDALDNNRDIVIWEGVEIPLLRDLVWPFNTYDFDEVDGYVVEETLEIQVLRKKETLFSTRSDCFSQKIEI